MFGQSKLCSGDIVPYLDQVTNGCTIHWHFYSHPYILYNVVPAMLCGLLPTLVSLIILAPADAYDMDDTNSSIVYTGGKWSPVLPNTQPWVESGGVFFASL